MKKYIFLLMLISIFSFAYSQVAVGEWRDHFSFREVKFITETNDEIVSATENGIFTYNKTDKSINKLTKVNGLSDVGISSLNFYETRNLTLVGYANGNIDIIIDNVITNIPDIKNKNVPAGKTINNVVFKDNFAFLSCGFGIIKLSLDKFEISETFYIGQDAALIEVFKVIYDTDYFYASCENGIYRADVNSPNLADFNNWIRIENIPNYNRKFTDILFFQDNMYALFFDENINKKTVYKYSNNNWKIFKNGLNKKTNISKSDNKFIIIEPKKIYIYNENGLNVRNIVHYNEHENSIDPNTVFQDIEGKLWIADRYLGLVEEIDENNYNFIYPNGPSSSSVLRIESAGNTIVATMGGFASTGVNNWNPGTYYAFSENTWTNVSNRNTFDYYEIAINPIDPSNFYIGSWGHGIIEYQDNELVQTYNSENTPLQSIIQGKPYIRVGGLSFDNDNNLWSYNSCKNRPLNVFKTDGTWQSFSFGDNINVNHPRELIITEDNIVWVQFKNNEGILVFNPNNTIDETNDDEFAKFYPKDESGNIFGQALYSIAEDLEGYIWIGSDKGVAVFNNPLEFNEDGFHANRIKISGEINDTIITNYLLEKEVVKTIEVDGANKKWFGTQNSGAYYMSEDCTKELLHFTTENSPLPSNTIYSIAVNNTTGEVYFATNYGIISYRGEATTGADEFKDVYVFPNPVRHEYTGMITVTGLVENVNVKITDVTGNIVFETTALGGQAIWDGNNFSGQRVQTGVYLVFCSNEDGSKTHITKLLFIN